MGYSTIFTTFSSSKAGVAILFNNNFQFQILKHFADPREVFIITDIDTGDKIMTLVVVVKKRFLGHHQKFKKVPLKSTDRNKF